jgi:hypothetical protein
VTLFLADVASYQQGLSVADFVRAGVDILNFKISHGLGQRSVHPDVTVLAAQAKQLRLPAAAAARADRRHRARGGRGDQPGRAGRDAGRAA